MNLPTADLSEISAEQLRAVLQLQQDLLDLVIGGDPSRPGLDAACRLFEQAVPGSLAAMVPVGAADPVSGPTVPADLRKQLVPLAAAINTQPSHSPFCGSGVVLLDDPALDGAWKTWRKPALDQGLKGCWSIPIFGTGERFLGSFLLFRTKRGLPTQLDSQMLGVAARTLPLLLHSNSIAESQSLLANALESVKEGVVIIDPVQQIVYANSAFETLTGYPIEELRGRDWTLLAGPETDARTRLRVGEAIRQGTSFSGEILHYRKDGTRFWNLLTINPLCDGTGRISHFVGVQRDITHLRSLNAQLEYQALHDTLTGLPNRRALDSHLNNAIARADRTGRPLAVAIFDLDDFKQLNNRFGHCLGDALLKKLSERLREVLRRNEYLARLGGDEFITVFEDLGDAPLDGQLTAIANRLDRAMKAPFEPAPGQELFIRLSMGVAIYPQDGREAGALMRLADSALYLAKEHKGDRAQWWVRHGSDAGPFSEIEENIDPYGPEAAEILSGMSQKLNEALTPFIEHFYRHSNQEPGFEAIFSQLTEQQLAGFKEQLKAHFQLLLGPGTRYGVLREGSEKFGRLSMLSGVDGVMLLHIFSIYRRLLSDYLNRQPMSARRRYRILQVVEQRLQDDMGLEFRTQASIHGCFLEYSLRPMPERLVTWSDTVAEEVDLLARLPGIPGAFLIRQSSQGEFKIEAAAGRLAQDIAAVLRRSGIETDSASPLPSDGSLMFRAWHTGQIESLASLALERRDPSWDGLLAELTGLGVNTFTHIPIADEFGHTIALISLCGGLPSQFESVWFRQFARNLQHRWREIWLRCSQPPHAVSQEQSAAYRQRLFNGGLQMYVQPVVDLATGALVKVEALARLVTEDGDTLGPGVFLPLLGDAELDRLFRLGLEQILSLAAHWEAQGHSLSVSLNLPPRTLLDPDCPAWVQHALDRHGIKANRLTLELLERQDIDPVANDAAIARLLKLGVKLAMDDLGSGFSSLQRLASVPFDTIKIDQSLLAKIRSEPIQTLSLIATIIQMGVDFGHDVIVEGLEDAGMVEAARILGGYRGQGYGIARPMPPDQLHDWCRDFQLPIEPDRINTLLGAVAFQWQSTRQGHSHHCAHQECLLTHFLAAQEPGHAREARWHAEIHAVQDNHTASRRLLDALVTRLLEEGEY